MGVWYALPASLWGDYDLMDVLESSRGVVAVRAPHMELANSIKNVSSEHRQVLDIHPPTKFACGVSGLDLGEQGTPQHL